MVFGRFGAKEVREILAATSRRHNVATPGQQKKVNKWPNVATSQRRDVTTISTPASLKARGDLILRGLKNVWTKARKAEQQCLGSLEKTLPFVFLLFCKQNC